MNTFLNLTALLVLCSATFATPLGGNGVEPSLYSVDISDPNEHGFGASQLVESLTNLRASAGAVLRFVESTLVLFDSAVQHDIRKRQTSVDASVEGGPNGPRGNVDVNHQGSSGNYGVGVSHDKTGTSVHGSYDKTFNNGDSKVSVSGGRDSNGDSYGRIDFSHNF